MRAQRAYNRIQTEEKKVMGASKSSNAILMGLLTLNGWCQTTVSDDPLGSRPLVISGVPIVEGTARDYQKFFDEVKNLGSRPLSEEARKTLHLTDQELRSLITITADLATESLFFRPFVKPWVFESRMEVTESGSISPPLQEKLRDLQNQWARTILDYAQRLKAAFGEERFQSVDEFIHSGKSMFEKRSNASTPNVAPEQKSN